MPADVWRDASVLARELRLLADIALRSFVDDVLELVQTQVWNEIQPILQVRDSDQYHNARSRRDALNTWLALDKPLDWGEYGTTRTSLLRAVSADDTIAARGLPRSAKGEWSVSDFVDHLLHVGQSFGMSAVRPPVWNKGHFWPVLRAAVTEGLRRARQHSDAPIAMLEVKSAFVHVVQELSISAVPDATPPPPGSTRPSLQPSIDSWTLIGVTARHARPGVPAPLTSQESVEFQIARSTLRSMELDPSTAWDTTEIVISDYHKYLGRTALPSNWDHVEATRSKDLFSRTCYTWAEAQLSTKLIDWRCDLALHLGYLISKVIPLISWPSDSTSLLASFQSIQAHSDPAAAIQAFRALPWQTRPSSKGALRQSLYFTQATIVFLLWIDSSSPLRVHLKKGTLGRPWSNKHGQHFFPHALTRHV